MQDSFGNTALGTYFEESFSYAEYSTYEDELIALGINNESTTAAQDLAKKQFQQSRIETALWGITICNTDTNTIWTARNPNEEYPIMIEYESM